MGERRSKRWLRQAGLLSLLFLCCIPSSLAASVSPNRIGEVIALGLWPVDSEIVASSFLPKGISKFDGAAKPKLVGAIVYGIKNVLGDYKSYSHKKAFVGYKREGRDFHSLWMLKRYDFTLFRFEGERNIGNSGVTSPPILHLHLYDSLLRSLRALQPGRAVGHFYVSTFKRFGEAVLPPCDERQRASKQSKQDICKSEIQKRRRTILFISALAGLFFSINTLFDFGDRVWGRIVGLAMLCASLSAPVLLWNVV